MRTGPGRTRGIPPVVVPVAAEVIFSPLCLPGLSGTSNAVLLLPRFHLPWPAMPSPQSGEKGRAAPACPASELRVLAHSPGSRRRREEARRGDGIGRPVVVRDGQRGGAGHPAPHRRTRSGRPRTGRWRDLVPAGHQFTDEREAGQDMADDGDALSRMPMRKGSCSRPGPRSPTGCSSSASGTCGRSWPSTRPTTTDVVPIAAASSTRPGPTTLPPTSPRSGSSVGPSLVALSANTSEPPKSLGQDGWPSSGAPRVAQDQVLCGLLVSSRQDSRSQGL